MRSRREGATETMTKKASQSKRSHAPAKSTRAVTSGSRSHRPRRGANVRRAERLLQTDISCIHADEFEDADAQRRILSNQADEPHTRPGRLKAPADVPAHLAHLWKTALLTPEEERSLFRSMNFLKYLASSDLRLLDARHPSVRLMNRIEKRLEQAQKLKNHIVQANMRLVVSIARRFSWNFTTFDDLVSDGNVVLVRAADQFDYSRGFRFSTYATHAIQREFYRCCQQSRKRESREVTMPPDVMTTAFEARETSRRKVEDARQMDKLEAFMDQNLRDRDRRIVNMRFGLNPHEAKMTLQKVGEEFGISKERVRQLQTRAIARIKEWALEDSPNSDLTA